MFKFDKKPEQHIPHLEKNKSQQQMRGGSQYDAMRRMSSLVGNQAMLAMMQSSGQSQSNETPFTSQMRKRFELSQRPATQSKASERTSAGGASLPDYLREKFERKSGLPLDDVRVHYNSDQPEQLGALAYTQGTDVYVGPGQEEHLEHELGHVVQQKYGLVRPQRQKKGFNINDDDDLEQKANDVGTYGAAPKSFRLDSDVIQMQPETFFPDIKEPHLHIHDGGVTYTDKRHKHKLIKAGDDIRINTTTRVIDELNGEGTDKAKQIIDYILNKLCSEQERESINAALNRNSAIDYDRLLAEMGMDPLDVIWRELAGDRTGYLNNNLRWIDSLAFKTLVMKQKYPNNDELKNDIWKLYLEYKAWIESETDEDTWNEKRKVID